MVNLCNFFLIMVSSKALSDVVVIGLDIFKDFLLRLIPGEEGVLIDQFGFDGLEERLSHRIIPAVSFAAHALHEAMMIEHFREATTGILHSTVRMNRSSLSEAVVATRPV